MAMIPVYTLIRYIPDVSINEYIPMGIDFITSDLNKAETFLSQQSDYMLGDYVVTFGCDRCYIDDSLCDFLSDVSLFYETLGDLTIQGLSFMKYISPIYSYSEFLTKSEQILSGNPDRHGIRHLYVSASVDVDDGDL